jgi:SAM-dependent methyltransferase
MAARRKELGSSRALVVMNIDYLNKIRISEMTSLIDEYEHYFRNKRILEIGSGTGIQLNFLLSRGFDVVGIDINESNYRANADDRIKIYNGHDIPFADKSFDLVFSSNVLEHIAHRTLFQSEIRRVLKDDGACLHLLPSPYWKFWTTIVSLCLFGPRLLKRVLYKIFGRPAIFPATWAGWLDLMIGERHGEFGNRVSELFHFSPAVWRREFEECMWHIIEVKPGNLFYEGNVLFGLMLSIETRKALSKFLGSTCNVFVIRK